MLGRFVLDARGHSRIIASRPVDAARIERALAHALVLYALEGQALPGEFGGPFRLLVAEGDDCSVNVKFLASLEFLEEPGSHTARCSD